MFTAAPALVRSGSSSVPHSAFPSSGSSRTRTPRRRRSGAARLTSAHRSSFTPLPSPSCFPFGGGSGRGQNPNVGWWRGQLLLALLPLLLNPRCREVMAKFRGCPGSVRPAAVAAPLASLSPRHGQGHGAGANESFPSPARLDSRAHAPAPSACAPAGWLGRAPRRASGCDGTGGGAVWLAGWLAGWVGGRGKADKRGPRASG
jgi:hypothetical protein